MHHPRHQPARRPLRGVAPRRCGVTDRIDSGALRLAAKAERDEALARAERLRTSPFGEDYAHGMLAYDDARHAAWHTYLAAVLAIGDSR